MRLFDRFSKPPSKDRFAQMVTDCIRRAGEKGRIVYDRDQFRLIRPGEKGTRLFLNNAYEEYCAVAKEHRAAYLRMCARSWFITDKVMPEEYEDVKPDLLPTVRARAYYENAALHMRIEGQPNAGWPQQVIGDHLGVSVVYDLPESMRSITQDDLDSWGVSFYEVLEAARENLVRLPHAFIGPTECEGVYLSATNDNYDASRLLLLDTIRQLRVKGDYIAMVPNRDTLIVTGSDDVKGLEGMVALAKDALQKPRPMSGIAVRLDSDDWVPWLPDVSHPHYQEFRALQFQSHGQNYNEQKELLDKLHEKNQQDIFVASFAGMEDKATGQIITYCVWSREVLTLLPRTDRVAFVEKDREPTMAAWDRVVEVVGGLMKPLDMYPVRYRVEEFPSDGQLAAMGNLL